MTPRRAVVALALWSVLLWAGGCVGHKPPASVPPTETAASVRDATAPLPDPGRATRVVFEPSNKVASVDVELAVTAATRRRGLMGRESLDAGKGMLFVFDKLELQKFWMRNTLIPLDMIFIAGEPSGRGARVVGVVHEATPHSTELRFVEQASRFVLEVPGGWAGAQGIRVGVTVRFEGPLH